MLNNTALWKEIASGRQLVLIAGPCVVENEKLCLEVADNLSAVSEKLGLLYVFKASFDKANRSSKKSFRGLGMEAGLRILAKVRNKIGVPVLTDIHDASQARKVGKVVDIVQIPALLCRQTDLIVAATKTGKIVNIKKGQFMSPVEMRNVLDKVKLAGGEKAMLTERGTTFGYNNLVSDMRSVPIMRGFGAPVIFDATHSVQMPGGAGDRSGGQREFAPILARAAVAAGADGVFIETHPNPDKALSDGPNMIQLGQMPEVLQKLVSVWNAVR